MTETIVLARSKHGVEIDGGLPWLCRAFCVIRIHYFANQGETRWISSTNVARSSFWRPCS